MATDNSDDPFSSPPFHMFEHVGSLTNVILARLGFDAGSVGPDTKLRAASLAFQVLAAGVDDMRGSAPSAPNDDTVDVGENLSRRQVLAAFGPTNAEVMDIAHATGHALEAERQRLAFCLDFVLRTVIECDDMTEVRQRVWKFCENHPRRNDVEVLFAELCELLGIPAQTTQPNPAPLPPELASPRV